MFLCYRIRVSLALRADKATERSSRQDAVITKDRDQLLDRAKRRLLRRIYNGRSVPIVVDDRPFLTYKDAIRYLLSLTPDARDKAYVEMRNSAASGCGTQE